MLDFSFENILHSNLINFAAMVVILAYIGKKINLGAQIEKLQSEIKTRVTNSDEHKKSSQEFLQQTEKSLETLDNELLKIKNDADTAAENMTKKIMTEAHNQVDKFEANAQKNIENEISKVQDELKQEVATDTIKLAKEKIAAKLENNYELHKKLINESIEKLDRVEF